MGKAKQSVTLLFVLGGSRRSMCCGAGPERVGMVDPAARVIEHGVRGGAGSVRGTNDPATVCQVLTPGGSLEHALQKARSLPVDGAAKATGRASLSLDDRWQM
jgi:hypothetical protein